MAKKPSCHVPLAGGEWRLYLAAAIAIIVVAAVVRVCGPSTICGWTKYGRCTWLARSHRRRRYLPKFIGQQPYLNTLYLYLVGPHGNWPGYRIPSISGRRRRRRPGRADRSPSECSQALSALLLTGFSYVLVLYSSEARGYASAVFFAFLSFYLLDRYWETKRWPLALMFSLSTVLGVLSHLVFWGFTPRRWSGQLSTDEVPTGAKADRDCGDLLPRRAYPFWRRSISWIFATHGHRGTPSTLLTGYGAALHGRWERLRQLHDIWRAPPPSSFSSLGFGCSGARNRTCSSSLSA